MDVVAAPYLAAGLLLVVAGVSKAIDPLSLVRALMAAGVAVRAPVLARVVRVVAVAEAVLGGLAVVTSDRLVAALVAVSYAGFTVFVVRALRSGSPLASCGCFGQADTPPARLHAVMTAALAGCALYATTGPAPGRGFALLAVTGVLAYLTYLVLAVLPLVPTRAVR